MANFNFNKIILGGRLSVNPELKMSSGGKAVCSFSIAVNRKAKKGELPRADFFYVRAWEKRAEFICNYFRKGDPIFIVGPMFQRKVPTPDGKERTFYEVIVDEVTFVDATSANPTPKKPKKEPEPETADDYETYDDPGYDLPF